MTEGWRPRRGRTDSRTRVRRTARPLLVALTLAIAAYVNPGAAGEPDDAYIAGYVAAILDREFQVGGLQPRVLDGVVTLSVGKLTPGERDQLKNALAGVPGVRGVEFVDDGAAAPPQGAGTVTPTQARPVASAAEVTRDLAFLPGGRLFEPLLADPRWPHFSVGYQNYMGDEELDNVGATSFGETFGLVRGDAPFEGQWQLGFQASVFAIFDLGAESKDLINADYWVGFPLSYRRGDLSGMIRVFHQSSHLGDEFLLRNRIDRVNLSYEGLDLKLSYWLGKGVRVYGGGGLLVHKEPSDLAPWSTQAGAEYRSPATLFGSYLRPIAGLDVQNREESDWRPDVSVRAGVQFENPKVQGPEIQLLAEYFTGRNPNGQFYERTLEYLGLGLHGYF